MREVLTTLTLILGTGCVRLYEVEISTSKWKETSMLTTWRRGTVGENEIFVDCPESTEDAAN